MIINVKISIPSSGSKDPYEMMFEKSIDPKNIDLAVERVEDMPDAVAKFVRESIQVLKITTEEVKAMQIQQE